MWQAEDSEIDGGRQYRLIENGDAMPFRRMFALLANDDRFVDWYTGILAAFEGAAFYWELPPLAVSGIDRDAEFVLIGAPALSRISPDPGPFADPFAQQPDKDVIAFSNLGGDATLIVPRGIGPAAAYPHFAAFLRLADEAQIRSLWRTVGQTMTRRLGEDPIWLSTAGLGVSWLHLRLDSRPKYYRYRPYARSASRTAR